METKRLNVYIDKKTLTQFQGINRYQFDHNNKRYDLSILDSYSLNIKDSKIHSNADIFVVGHHDIYNKLDEFRTLLGNKLVYTRRQRKSSNIATYHSLLSHIPSYVQLDIYGNFDENEDYSQYVFRPLEYYVKPEYGARSINQFIIDNDKTSLAYFLAKLNSSYNTDKDVYAKNIEELVNSANGAIKHIKGCEREENEHSKHKLVYCVHSRFDDVSMELRVINNFGKDLFYFIRERNAANDGIVDNEINYVREATLEDFKKCSIDAAKFKEIDIELKKAFATNNFHNGSIDLVFDANGLWSIIETSNQYGAADIKPIDKMKIIRNFFAHLLDHCEIE